MANEIDTLITNHSKTDHYDYRDYNRVGTAVAYVAGLLNNDCGFSVSVTAKHDWAAADVLTQSDIDRYLADIQTCRDALTQLSTTPDAPGSMKYDVDTANRIEKILADVDDSIRRMKQTWFYSGEIGCGEV